jgi:simple sugar transport system permease protein
MNILANILYDSVYHTAPILLCVLGGIFAYKANVLNIALEGIMLTGSFVSVLIAYFTHSLLLAYLGAIAACMLVGLMFSLMSVKLSGNVIIVGLAVNMLVPAIAAFVLQYMQSANINLQWMNLSDLKIVIPFVKDIPIVGRLLSGHPPITYLAFLGILVMSVVMYKTRFGVYVRVVGENEDAAVNLGLRTRLLKHAAILIGAFCCALAGVNLSLERLGLFTNNMTAGRGFIAIAAIYCGRGDPVRCSLYAIVFGVARALAVNMGLFAGPTAALFDVVPYVVMAVVLTVVSAIKQRNSMARGF